MIEESREKRQSGIPKKVLIPALVLAVAGLFIAAGPAVHGAGDETCGACHEEVIKAFQATPHAAIPAGDCTSCHTGAEKHREEGGKGNIFAFAASDIPNAKAKKCLSCHSGDIPRYQAGPHAKASLDCTSCHSVHAAGANPSLLKTGKDKNCSLCHEDVFALFKLNERHRLQEGIMECVTCHNPHEPQSRERLGGFKDLTCLKCHADKGGPYLYEHAASRLEGCTVCHEVHGSPNRHLLKQHNIADLCYSCHTSSPAWHSRFTSTTTNCTSCHATIHGSNLSRLFLK